jgi:hypothetical protein
MEAIDARRPVDAARIYLRAFNWPIALGHRYRPRAGCTCENIECPTPGAHPLPGPFKPIPADDIEATLDTAPGAGIIAACAAFDALVMPRWLGLATMVPLDRVSPVPFIDCGAYCALLVLPSTGRYALGEQPPAAVTLRTSAQQWVALPPTHGTRWDPPPWQEQTGVRLPLLHGGDVGRHMLAALNHVGA